MSAHSQREGQLTNRHHNNERWERAKRNQRGFGRDSEWFTLIALLVILSAIAAPIAKKAGLHPGIGVLVVLGLYAIYFTYLRIQDYLYFRELAKKNLEAPAIGRASPDFPAKASVALEEKNPLETAIDKCRGALESNPNDPQAHYNLGVALSHNEQLEAAIASYRTALELNPVYAEAHYRLGLALGQSGQLDGAIACLRKALEIKPDFVDARNVLSVLLKEEGKQAAVRHEFEEAGRLHPKK